jgi:catechol 2,3-dioxygenase-like lactoylglutathione lyase family enzyme
MLNTTRNKSGEQHMDLGAFSVSLNVKDIAASKAFYEKLGFTPIGGNAAENWLILRNGDHVIGLFQGMFERNLLTFNPGWDQQCNETAEHTDVREIQRRLRAAGIPLVNEADEKSEGPASCMVIDPDGNPILIDQHR